MRWPADLSSSSDLICCDCRSFAGRKDGGRSGGVRRAWQSRASPSSQSARRRYSCVDAANPSTGEIPRPVYGPLYPFYLGFFALIVVAVIGLYVRDLRRTSGMQKGRIPVCRRWRARSWRRLVAFTPLICEPGYRGPVRAVPGRHFQPGHRLRRRQLAKSWRSDSSSGASTSYAVLTAYLLAHLRAGLVARLHRVPSSFPT